MAHQDARGNLHDRRTGRFTRKYQAEADLEPLLPVKTLEDPDVDQDYDRDFDFGEIVDPVEVDERDSLDVDRWSTIDVSATHYRVAPATRVSEPEPTRGPGPGTVSPVDAIDWPTTNKRRVASLKDLAERLGELHGINDNGLGQTALVLGTNRGGGKGGHFSPSAPPGPRPRRRRDESLRDFIQRSNDWARAPRRPEIRVNDRGKVVGEEQMSFLHEVGHRMDALPVVVDWEVPVSSTTGMAVRTRSSQWFSEHGYRNSNSEAAEAFRDFIEAAKKTDNIANAHQHFGRSFSVYHRDVKEVWARAYSQWAANELGGEAREALTVWQRGKSQWSDEEFEELAPLVEAVLRKTGAMR